MAGHPWPRKRRAGAPSAIGLWEQIDDESGKSEGWFLITERDGVHEGAIARMFIKPGDIQSDLHQVHGRSEERALPGPHHHQRHEAQRHEIRGRHHSRSRDGKVYDAVMELSPDGQKLTVRGYLGITFLGRSQVWKRLPQTALAEVDPAVIAPHMPAPPEKPAQKQQPSPPQRPKGAAPRSRRPQRWSISRGLPISSGWNRTRAAKVETSDKGEELAHAGGSRVLETTGCRRRSRW